MAWDRGPDKDSQEKTTVVVSRHWNNPNIAVTVNQDKIEIVCGISDFVLALSEEMPPPWKIWGRAKHRREALAAMLRAVEKIKETSARVM